MILQPHPLSLRYAEQFWPKSTLGQRKRRVTLHTRNHRLRPAAAAQVFTQDFDQGKEASFKDRRDVYDFDRWQRHRASSRYIRHLATTFRSEIIKGILWPVAIEAMFTAAVCYYEFLHDTGQLPLNFPDLAVTADISGPFGLSTFALSLLLVFRTNTSYARFDEARKFWGGVVNRSRDVVRQGAAWFDPVTEKDRLDALARWMAAFPWVMKCHLRAREDPREELKDILRPEELRYLLSTAHRPNTVLQVLSGLIWGSNLDQDKKFRMDENLTAFSDYLGASERLLRTPIPPSYTRHTSRFLILWLVGLPFVLWDAIGWATIPTAAVIAFVLLAIDEIGVQIEEPFSILPLEAISTTITTNIRQIMNDESRRYDPTAARLYRERFEGYRPPSPAVEAAQAAAAAVRQAAATTPITEPAVPVSKPAPAINGEKKEAAVVGSDDESNVDEKWQEALQESRWRDAVADSRWSSAAVENRWDDVLADSAWREREAGWDDEETRDAAAVKATASDEDFESPADVFRSFKKRLEEVKMELEEAYIINARTTDTLRSAAVGGLRPATPPRPQTYRPKSTPSPTPASAFREGAAVVGDTISIPSRKPASPLPPEPRKPPTPQPKTSPEEKPPTPPSEKPPPPKAAAAMETAVNPSTTGDNQKDKKPLKGTGGAPTGAPGGLDPPPGIPAALFAALSADAVVGDSPTVEQKRPGTASSSWAKAEKEKSEQQRGGKWQAALGGKERPSTPAKAVRKDATRPATPKDTRDAAGSKEYIVGSEFFDFSSRLQQQDEEPTIPVTAWDTAAGSDSGADAPWNEGKAPWNVPRDSINSTLSSGSESDDWDDRQWAGLDEAESSAQPDSISGVGGWSGGVSGSYTWDDSRASTSSAWGNVAEQDSSPESASSSSWGVVEQENTRPKTPSEGGATQGAWARALEETDSRMDKRTDSIADDWSFSWDKRADEQPKEQPNSRADAESSSWSAQADRQTDSRAEKETESFWAEDRSFSWDAQADTAPINGKTMGVVEGFLDTKPTKQQDVENPKDDVKVAKASSDSSKPQVEASKPAAKKGKWRSMMGDGQQVEPEQQPKSSTRSNTESKSTEPAAEKEPSKRPRTGKWASMQADAPTETPLGSEKTEQKRDTASTAKQAETETALAPQRQQEQPRPPSSGPKSDSARDVDAVRQELKESMREMGAARQGPEGPLKSYSDAEIEAIMAKLRQNLGRTRDTLSDAKDQGV